MFRRTCDRSMRRGFTLVEILCVVVILGIASAVIIPQIGSRNDLVASAAARVVMSDLIYAQNRAIATQQRQFVQFVGQQYSLMTRNNDTSPLYAITHPVTKNAYSVTFGGRNTGLENVVMTGTDFAGRTIVGFDELGSPFAFNAATNTITPLVNEGTIAIQSGNFPLTIAIEPYTGETTVN